MTAPRQPRITQILNRSYAPSHAIAFLGVVALVTATSSVAIGTQIYAPAPRIGVTGPTAEPLAGGKRIVQGSAAAESPPEAEPSRAPGAATEIEQAPAVSVSTTRPRRPRATRPPRGTGDRETREGTPTAPSERALLSNDPDPLGGGTDLFGEGIQG